MKGPELVIIDKKSETKKKFIIAWGGVSEAFFSLLGISENPLPPILKNKMIAEVIAAMDWLSPLHLHYKEQSEAQLIIQDHQINLLKQNIDNWYHKINSIITSFINGFSKNNHFDAHQSLRKIKTLLCCIISIDFNAASAFMVCLAAKTNIKIADLFLYVCMHLDYNEAEQISEKLYSLLQKEIQGFAQSKLGKNISIKPLYPVQNNDHILPAMIKHVLYSKENPDMKDSFFVEFDVNKENERKGVINAIILFYLSNKDDADLKYFLKEFFSYFDSSYNLLYLQAQNFSEIATYMHHCKIAGKKLDFGSIFVNQPKNKIQSYALRNLEKHKKVLCPRFSKIEEIAHAVISWINSEQPQGLSFKYPGENPIHVSWVQVNSNKALTLAVFTRIKNYLLQNRVHDAEEDFQTLKSLFFLTLDIQSDIPRNFYVSEKFLEKTAEFFFLSPVRMLISILIYANYAEIEENIESLKTLVLSPVFITGNANVTKDCIIKATKNSDSFLLQSLQIYKDFCMSRDMKTIPPDFSSFQNLEIIDPQHAALTLYLVAMDGNAIADSIFLKELIKNISIYLDFKSMYLVMMILTEGYRLLELSHMFKEICLANCALTEKEMTMYYLLCEDYNNFCTMLESEGQNLNLGITDLCFVVKNLLTCTTSENRKAIDILFKLSTQENSMLQDVLRSLDTDYLLIFFSLIITYDVNENIFLDKIIAALDPNNLKEIGFYFLMSAVKAKKQKLFNMYLTHLPLEVIKEIFSELWENVFSLEVKDVNELEIIRIFYDFASKHDDLKAILFSDMDKYIDKAIHNTKAHIVQFIFLIKCLSSYVDFRKMCAVFTKIRDNYQCHELAGTLINTYRTHHTLSENEHFMLRLIYADFKSFCGLLESECEILKLELSDLCFVVENVLRQALEGPDENKAIEILFFLSSQENLMFQKVLKSLNRYDLLLLFHLIIAFGIDEETFLDKIISAVNSDALKEIVLDILVAAIDARQAHLFNIFLTHLPLDLVKNIFSQLWLQITSFKFIDESEIKILDSFFGFAKQDDDLKNIFLNQKAGFIALLKNGAQIHGLQDSLRFYKILKEEIQEFLKNYLDGTMDREKGNQDNLLLIKLIWYGFRYLDKDIHELLNDQKGKHKIPPEEKVMVLYNLSSSDKKLDVPKKITTTLRFFYAQVMSLLIKVRTYSVDEPKKITLTTITKGNNLINYFYDYANLINERIKKFNHEEEQLLSFLDLILKPVYCGIEISQSILNLKKMAKILNIDQFVFLNYLILYFIRNKDFENKQDINPIIELYINDVLAKYDSKPITVKTKSKELIEKAFKLSLFETSFDEISVKMYYYASAFNFLLAGLSSDKKLYHEYFQKISASLSLKICLLDDLLARHDIHAPHIKNAILLILENISEAKNYIKTLSESLYKVLNVNIVSITQQLLALTKSSNDALARQIFYWIDIVISKHLINSKSSKNFVFELIEWSITQKPDAEIMANGIFFKITDFILEKIGAVKSPDKLLKNFLNYLNLNNFFIIYDKNSNQFLFSRILNAYEKTKIVNKSLINVYQNYCRDVLNNLESLTQFIYEEKGRAFLDALILMKQIFALVKIEKFIDSVHFSFLDDLCQAVYQAKLKQTDDNSYASNLINICLRMFNLLIQKQSEALKTIEFKENIMDELLENYFMDAREETEKTIEENLREKPYNLDDALELALQGQPEAKKTECSDLIQTVPSYQTFRSFSTLSFFNESKNLDKGQAIQHLKKHFLSALINEKDEAKHPALPHSL